MALIIFYQDEHNYDVEAGEGVNYTSWKDTKKYVSLYYESLGNTASGGVTTTASAAVCGRLWCGELLISFSGCGEVMMMLSVEPWEKNFFVCFLVHIHRVC